MALEWIDSQALRHYLLGVDVPVGLLTDKALEAVKWVGSYTMEHGKMPSEQHLDSIYGVDLTELQDWEAVTSQLTESYVKRTLSTVMKTAGDAVALSGRSTDAVAALELGLAAIRERTNTGLKSTMYAADAEATMAAIVNRMNSSFQPRVAKFGLPSLDDITNGVETGDYILLYGQSASGKSTVKRRFISSFLKQGKRVLSITLENPKEVEVMQMHAMDTGKNARDYLRYEMAPGTLLQMHDKFRELVYSDGYGECIVEDRLDPKNMASVANLVMKHNIDIVVIDQLTLFAASREWKDMAPTSTEARAFAIRGVPVIMLSQEDDKGQLKYGRALYEDATKVIRVTPNPKQPTDVKMLVIEKNRTGEMHAQIALDYDPKNSRVEEIPAAAPQPVYTGDTGSVGELNDPKGW